MEDLRELCIYNLYSKKQPDVWWDYMKHVHSQCYNGVSKLCSKRAHKDLVLDWQRTINCVDNSFEDNDLSKNNALLAEEALAWT